jgi:hypothetical protein
MRMRTLMVGMMAAGLVGGMTDAARADRMELKLSSPPGQSSVAEITVDGPNKNGSYNAVYTETLAYYVMVRGDVPDKTKGDGMGFVQLEGGEREHVEVDGSWTRYKIIAPYKDPWSTAAANERSSPIKLCNDLLKLTSGAARASFLKKGDSFVHNKGYDVWFDVSYLVKKGLFYEDKFYDYHTWVPVRVTCMALDRPRPSKETSTTGAPPRHGQSLESAMDVDLRIEPAKVVKDGKFLCPSQLKLYGRVETGFKFKGKALFVGPHYLSAITTLDLQAKDTNTAIGTYNMDWQKMGGFTTAPNAEPKKQKLTFHFNVIDGNAKIVKSAEETVEVSCKKIKVAVPTVGDETTVTPAN